MNQTIGIRLADLSRAFGACLLSLLMFLAPLVPIMASTNPATANPLRGALGAFENRGTSRRQIKQALTPSEESENLSFVNSLSPIAPMFAPAVTATLTDNITAATKVVPGGTINYTAVISNTTTDATGVIYNDTLDAHTTLVVGSTIVSPIAFNDAYTATGNVAISVPAGSGVLANDFAGSNPAVTTVSASDTSSTQCPACGNVAVAADGSFTYTPPGNFTGTDTFTYTLTNSAASSVGTVTITVSDRIIFVDDAGAGSTCRPATPCTLATADGLAAPTGIDLVFVESGTYSGAAISLNASQKLAGQGVSIGQALTDAGITLKPNSQTLTFPASTVPVLNNAATVVTLSTNTLVEDLTINPSAGSAVLGTAITSGTTTVRDLTIGATSTANGVNLTSNTGGTFNLSNLGITGASGAGFTATGGGTVNVSGTNNVSTTAGAALNWNGDSSASTVTFNNVSSTTGGAVSITSSGATNFTFNDVTSTTGTAVNINTATGDFSFHKISSNGAPKGITVTALTGGGSFTVTGTGGSGLCDSTHIGASDCQGGTIQGASSRGIEFINAIAITLKNMYLKNDGTTAIAQSGATCNPDVGAGDNTACNAALYFNGATTVSLDRMFLDGGSGSSQDNGINANGVNGFTFTNSEVRNFWANQKDAANIQNPSGTWNIGNTFASPMPVTFDNNREAHNWFITANAGTPNITFTNTTISNSPLSGTGNASGITALSRAGSTVNITADHCTFTSIVSNTVNWAPTAGGNMTAVLSNSTATQVDSVDMSATGNNSTMNYTITGNTIATQASTGHSAINVGRGSVAPNGTNMTETGTVTSNNITVNSSTCSTCAGIVINSEGASGNSVTTVSNNTISGNNFNGIRVVANAGAQSMNLTMQGNTMTTTQTPANAGYGIDIVSGGSGSDTNCLFLNFGDMSVGHTVAANKNSVNGSWTNGSANKISLAIFDSAHIKMLNYGGATDAAAAAYVAASNVGGADAVHLGSNQFQGGTSCPLLFALGGISSAREMFPLVRSFDPSEFSEVNVSTLASPASSVSNSLSQSQLDSIVTASIQRWSATGLTQQQIATLRGIKFEVTDLSGSYLGEADGNRIQVDRSAEGKGWFVDPNPLSDSSFADKVSVTRLYTDPMTAAAGHIDLLTAIEHEMGHRLGLDDSYLEQDRDNIMYGYLTVGERRLPAHGQARGAQSTGLKGLHFLSLRSAPSIHVRRSDNKITPLSGEAVGPINIGTLPVGKSVTIKYQATVDSPPLVRSVSTQGTVSGSNFATINTDDPEPGGANDPTVTNIDVAITWTGATSTDWNTASNWNLTGPVVSSYAPGVSNPGVNDVVIPNVGAQPTIGTTDINVFSLNISSGRTLTIGAARTLTISGAAAGSDLTLDGIISGGALQFAGAGPHVITHTVSMGSISSTNTTTILGPAAVTLNNAAGNDLQMGSLVVNSGGSMTITGRTLSLNGAGGLSVAGTFTPIANGDGTSSQAAPPGDGLLIVVGSTVVFNGTGAQTLTDTTPLNNLTINNTGGSVTLGSNATVNGTLTLTSDLTTTNAFTVSQPLSSTTSGGGDVVGNLTRTNGGVQFPATTNITFGNPNTLLNFTAAGTRPTAINFRLTETAPTDAATGIVNTGFPGAVKRTWLITPTGGSGFSATMQLHYLVGDLNGNVETNPGPGSTVSLRLYKYVILSPSTGWQQQDFPAFANTTIDTSVAGSHFVKLVGVTGFSPWTIGGVSPTAATSTITGRITDDAGNPVEGAVIRLNGTQNRKTITDAFGNYTFSEVETNGFYTVTPSRANYNFAPATRGFSALGAHTDASFAGALNGNQLNPLDTTEYFVRQQYVDFLGREPEEKGFNDWTDTINNCTAGDTSCDRVHVSEAFFRSDEFQQRGYFVYRFYSTAFGQKPDYTAFAPDLGRVSGFLDATQLEAAKTQFAIDFTNRAAFMNHYGMLSNSAYVDALAQTAGVSLSNRQALVDSLSAGTMTRAQALRQIVESNEVYTKYYNQAFVVMEYFGYLRRDPDLLYLNWISVLDANPADSRHMVEGFVDATEYRNRFKQ